MGAAAGPLAIAALDPAELDRLEPLWLLVHARHAEVAPDLFGTPIHDADASWRVRRAKYERWLARPGCFALLAERGDRAVGYALVTVGGGHSSWRTGERMAELQSLAVVESERGRGVASALLEAVERRLLADGILDLQVGSVLANADAHRFYERHGLAPAFVTFYRRLDRPTPDPNLPAPRPPRQPS